MNIIRYSHALSVGICALFIFSVPSVIFASVDEVFEKTLDFHDSGKIYLKNVSGDIEITTWDKDQVEIYAKKVARNKDDLKNVDIDIEEGEKILRIRTEYKENGHKHNSSASVSFKLTIPANASIEVNSVSGDLSASSIGGKIESQTVSGDIQIDKADNDIKCSTVSGEVSVKNITGSASLSTVSGRIKVNEIKGSIDVESVSGDIELDNVTDALEIETQSVSGDIHFKGELNAESSFDLQSHSGDIDLILPPSANFDFYSNSFSGTIDCSFPIEETSRSKHKLKGIVGKGGAHLSVSTFSGNISIKEM